MANRETYPAAQSPLTGDVSGQAGASSVTVVGLQGVPIKAGTPVDQDKLVFQAANGDWESTADGNASITIGTFTTAGGVTTGKGQTISDDYDFSVNGIGFDVLVNWALGPGQVFINGVKIA